MTEEKDDQMTEAAGQIVASLDSYITLKINQNVKSSYFPTNADQPARDQAVSDATGALTAAIAAALRAVQKGGALARRPKKAVTGARQ